ncbi:MAG: hypothetical protein Q9216_002261 [Gyalolechia sp. 2 TL-2023]
MLKVRRNGQENRALLRCHQKHGPLVRTAPHEISICRLEDVRTVYSGNFEKEAWLARSSDNYGRSVRNMFSMEGMKKHAERKRILWEPYAKSRVLASATLEQLYHSSTLTHLIPQLEQAASAKDALNATDITCSWVMDFITVYLFGTDNCSNFLKDDLSRQDFFLNYSRRGRSSFWPAQFPGLFKFSKRIHLRLAPRILENSRQMIEDWCLELCNRAEISYNKGLLSLQSPPPIYSYLRQHLEKQEANQSSDTESATTRPDSLSNTIASEALDHCAAGQETAGTALSFCLHQLSRNPTVQTCLRNEIRAHFPEAPFLPLTLKDLEALPYLEAVVLETLRLHHHKPGPPRLTPAAGSMKTLLAAIYAQFTTALVEEIDTTHPSEKEYLAGSEGVPLFLRFEKVEDA